MLSGRCAKWMSILRGQRARKLCRFSPLGMSRRKCNLSLLTVLAVLVFGYIVLVDVVRQDFGSQNALLDPLYGSLNTYCSVRARLGHVKAHQAGDIFKFDENMPKDQACILPVMDPCDPEIEVFDKPSSLVNCSHEENWVYVDNGTFRISPKARRKFGKITCEYAPIVRGKGDYAARHAEHIKPMPDGSPLVSDFFKVACISPSGKRYHNIHAGVAFDKTLHERSEKVPLPQGGMGYDVFMFGFDSTSRMSWLRNLPRSRQFFVETLGGLELEGYNIVGDGTVQALLPILAGNTEHDLPTARRGETGAKEVDDYPWIWKKFKDSGYVTAWGEDMSYIGTFQMRLKGFRDQPTDHSMRTYFMLAEPMYGKFLPWCAGSEARHVRFMNWFRDLYHMYGQKPKFMFGFHSEFSHGQNNHLKKLDTDLYEFLKYLHSSGYLNHTILILMGDHGSRFSEIRRTAQGKLEERLPYFAFRFPPSFASSYPTAIKNFKINTRRLTTPFDIHETFHDILDFKDAPSDHTKERGISLFREVPKGRTCNQAGVEPHWCACLQWLPVNDQMTQDTVASVAIKYINELMSYLRNRCALLRISQIPSLSKFTPNPQLMRFKQSQDKHGDIPDLTDNTTLTFHYYQITFVTEPGDGQFEATIGYSPKSNKWQVSDKEISRTNAYGDNPACIAQSFPHLRPYCYCL